MMTLPENQAIASFSVLFAFRHIWRSPFFSIVKSEEPKTSKQDIEIGKQRYQTMIEFRHQFKKN